MAVLCDTKYIKILKDKIKLCLVGDGIANCYCTIVTYKSKQDREIEKAIVAQKQQFLTNLTQYMTQYTNNIEEELETLLNKFIKSFSVQYNFKPNVSDDLEFIDILDRCGYKESWYTTEIKMCPGETTLLVATVDLNNLTEPINYSFFYNKLKDYLVGNKVDV